MLAAVQPSWLQPLSAKQPPPVAPASSEQSTAILRHPLLSHPDIWNGIRAPEKCISPACKAYPIYCLSCENLLVCFVAYVKTDSSVADGWRRAIMAERRSRPELRLHVQAAHHREQLGGQDLLPLPVRWRFLHLGLRQHCWYRLQSEDCIQTGQEGQVANLGEFQFDAMQMELGKAKQCSAASLIVFGADEKYSILERYTGCQQTNLTNDSNRPADYRRSGLCNVLDTLLTFFVELFNSCSMSHPKTFDLQLLKFTIMFKYDDLWKKS